MSRLRATLSVVFVAACCAANRAATVQSAVEEPLQALLTAQEFGPSEERARKAVCAYRFTAFVGWPDEAFPAPSSPFVVGVVGDGHVLAAVKAAFGGRQVGRRPVVFKRIESLKDVSHCQLLYVGGGGNLDVGTVLARTRGAMVLTVADLPNGAEKGAVFGLFVEGSRIRWVINMGAARAAGLRINAQLSRLAKRVISG